MSHVGYLIVGWGGSLLVLGSYATLLIVRGRALSARVPPERRRWMTTADDS
jgi:hypothetical protein